MVSIMAAEALATLGAMVLTLIHQNTPASTPQGLTLLMLETEYSGLGGRYHARWCPGF